MAKQDFDKFVNAEWKKKHPIPQWRGSWGAFSCLRHKVDKQLKAILEKLPKSSPLSILYHSAMNMKERNKAGIKPLRILIRPLLYTTSLEQLLTLTYIFHCRGVTPFFSWYPHPDDKKRGPRIPIIYPSGVGLPHAHFTKSKYTATRKKYQEYIAKMLRLSGSKNAKNEAKIVYKIEKQLASHMYSPEDARVAEKRYNPFTKKELEKLKFPWNLYWKHIPKAKRFVLTDMKYFRFLGSFLKKIPLDHWKIYFFWRLLNSYAGVLGTKFRKPSFEFYRKYLLGVRRMRPLWLSAVGAVKGTFPADLGHLYTKKHGSKKKIKAVKEMCFEIRKTFKKKFQELDWISNKTRKEALAKLANIRFRIGHRDKWPKPVRHLSGVDRQLPYGVIVMATSGYLFHKEIQKLGTVPKRNDWDDTAAYEVNAFYQNDINAVTIPMGIIQPPFYNEKCFFSCNYGSMGQSIGHELTHAFDDEGRKYDSKGKLRKWVSKKEEARLSKNIAKFHKFYKHVRIKGVKLNEKLGAGENMADLGGLQLAWETYQRLMEKKKQDPDKKLPRQKYTPDQLFFICHGKIQAENISKKAMEFDTETDPHIPNSVQLNLNMSSFTPYYDTFTVRRGDKMFILPRNRPPTLIWIC